MRKNCSRNGLWSGLLGVLLLLAFLTPVYAIERNTTTLKFVWEDDLSNTSGSNSAQRQIKPTHLPQIREAINRLVLDCGIASDPWFYTDAEVVAQIGSPGATMSSAQLNNLRRAIEELYRQKSLTTPSAILGNVVSGEPIDKPHVQDMRSALDNVAVTCPISGNCGNGVVNSGEQCDDGNAANGDGCNSMCKTETTCILGPAEEWGETACPGPDQRYPVCDQSWHEGSVVTLPNNRISNNHCFLPFDCGAYYALACTTGGCVQAGETVPAGGTCSGSSHQTIPWSQCCSGQATVNCPAANEPAEAFCAAVGGSGTCGNGVVESGEECDDNNAIPDDGCSAICKTEAACGNCHWIWNGQNWDDYCSNGCFCSSPGNLANGTGNGPTSDCSCYGSSCSGGSSGCQPDGYTWNRGGLPIQNAELISDSRCCTESAVCSAGTTTCSCGNGGAYGGGTGGSGGSSMPVCGNGVQEGTESCDNGGGNGVCPAVCSASCTVNVCSVCGNGVREGSEVCDNGGLNGNCPRTCSASCTNNSCGNGGGGGGYSLD